MGHLPSICQDDRKAQPAPLHETHKGSRYISPCPTLPHNIPRGFRWIVGLVGETGRGDQKCSGTPCGCRGWCGAVGTRYASHCLLHFLTFFR